MGRTILPGSRVLLDEVPAPSLGEIWAWCQPDGEIVVHRSLGRGRRGYRFQGDARRDLDPPVAPERIIGRVTAIEYRGMRRTLGWQSRWRGTVRLVALDVARAGYHVLPRKWRVAIRARWAR